MNEDPTRHRPHDREPFAGLAPPPPPIELRAAVLEAARRAEGESRYLRPRAWRPAWHLGWHLAWAAAALLLIALNLRLSDRAPATSDAAAAAATTATTTATTPAATVRAEEELIAWEAGIPARRFAAPGLWSGGDGPFPGGRLADDSRWRMELRKEGVL